jgi:hypothetical protein
MRLATQRAPIVPLCSPDIPGAHASLGNPLAVVWLLRELRWAGAAAEALLASNPAVR